jgi:hypothetical protein
MGLSRSSCVAALALLGCHEPRWGALTDAPAMHDSLVALAPIGTSTFAAFKTLGAAGFRCDSLHRATFGGRDTIPLVHCDLYISAGGSVSRRWQVALVDSSGSLTEIRVATGMIGP